MTASTIAIIGAGNMGAALAGGLVTSGYPPEKIWISNPAPEKLDRLSEQFAIQTTEDNREAATQADVILFAVKPAVLIEVATELKDLIQTRKPLVISIAAGIREAGLQMLLGGEVAIVRAMPNTPAMLGCGATALIANRYVSAEQRNLAESILRAVGVIAWLEDETLLDTVTALSGCGPAYFFLLMEVLQEAAEAQGLATDIARLLTQQTAFGAARMALESDETVVELRKRVTSAGGTTEQAIKILEAGDFRKLFAKALQAAKLRAEELAEVLNRSS